MLFLGIGSFYWFELRPNKIIKHCILIAVDKAKENQNSDREDVEYFYRKCLRENGLEIGIKANWKVN